jgi:lauroyl/myristoyl acyltransferase
MSLTFIRILQKIPGFSIAAARIHPVWYFKLTRWTVTLLGWVMPHTKKRARVFRETLRGSFDQKELKARTARYLYFVRLFKDIEIAWINWAKRENDWITIEGESHLKDALAQGQGAVLMSPHNYGMSKMVAPILSARGYKIHRGGNGGKKLAYRKSRWGKNAQIDWEYLAYKGDYWHRVQLLKSIQRALAGNEIVHVSPRGYQQGEPEMTIEFFGRKYFLDAIWFRIFGLCQAPVLPCFALPNADGQLRIIIHSAVQVTRETVAKQFAAIQSDYITQFPECGRLWKSVYVERGKW